ncbi:hypothetical protein GGR56DRAFT_634038 [Xylariaceae sp. FL0804]|nr:hypothetical protein GGR56DRAFT_634038 [Xylariaceae sp. FL0804]
MTCACRSTSLRLFVQGLTELRISDPGAARSVRRIPSSALPNTGRQYPSRPWPRPFSTTSAAPLPRQRWRDASGPDMSDGAEEALQSWAKAAAGRELSSAPSEEGLPGLKVQATQNLRAPTLDVPAVKIGQARGKGAIFDFSPESIDKLKSTIAEAGDPVLRDDIDHESAFTSEIPQRSVEELVANLELPPDQDGDPIMREDDDAEHAFDSAPRSRLKPPVGPSKLKRRKIMKDDPKPKPDEDQRPQRVKEDWQIQKDALKERFPEGWRPHKRLSPDALEGIRALHSQFPEQYTTETLAQQFAVSPDAIRRILRAKWQPSAEEEESRQVRWHNRGKQIWSRMAELGQKPPRKWRQEGIVRDPIWHQKAPRDQWPYVPRHLERQREPEESVQESVQRKLGGNLL